MSDVVNYTDGGPWDDPRHEMSTIHTITSHMAGSLLPQLISIHQF